MQDAYRGCDGADVEGTSGCRCDARTLKTSTSEQSAPPPWRRLVTSHSPDKTDTTLKHHQRLRDQNRTKTGTRGTRGQRIPESFSAFCSIVSFTAANTSLIFDVSVACVRLGNKRSAPSAPAPECANEKRKRPYGHSLRVYAEPRPICLHEPPQDVLRRLVNIGPARVLGEVPLEGDFWQLALEDVDLVQEQDDRCPEEPSRVDDRLKQDERLRHPFLREREEGGAQTQMHG